jgi:hypothetical protein
MSAIYNVKEHLDYEIDILNKCYSEICLEENRTITAYNLTKEAIHNAQVSLSTLDQLLETEVQRELKK